MGLGGLGFRGLGCLGFRVYTGLKVAPFSASGHSTRSYVFQDSSKTCLVHFEVCTGYET